MNKKIKAASVQFNHAPGDKTFNMARIRSFTERASGEKAAIVAFPEMCITGYWHIRNLAREDIEALSEPVPSGTSTRELLGLAAQYNLIVGAGLIEKDEDGTLYNTYVAAMPDGAFASHRKLHCFISPHMASGNSYTVFDTPLGIKLGILTCWDNNLIENVRATALNGADILLAPHQTGGCDSRSPHAMGHIDPQLWLNRKNDPEAIEAEFRGSKGREWLMRWLPSRAHDNGMFVIFSNGVGIDDDEVRTGNAMIIDPYGRIIAETCAADDALVSAELDLSLLPLCTGRRWMRGRRPELYGDLTKKTGKELDPRSARFSKE